MGEAYVEIRDNICAQPVTDLNYYLTLRKQRHNWLKNKIFFLRYEDLILDHGNYIDGVYKFVGLEKGKQHIKNIIYKETHGQDKYFDQDGDLTTYGTEDRDGHNMINKWSETLNWWLVRMVQEACGHQFFERLGYRIFKDEKEYETQRRKVSIENRRIVNKDWIFRIQD